MLRRRAAPLVKMVLLDNGNGRDDMYEPPEQHGDLVCETDVVHRSYELSCQTHSTRLGGGVGGPWVTCVMGHFS